MVDKLLAKKLHEYLEYIEKVYYSETSQFGFKNFDYFTKITKNNEFNTSTNSIENINLQLKKKSGSGPLPFGRALRVVKEFKCDFLVKLEEAVTNDNLNRRRSSTVTREQKIKMMLDEYAKKYLNGQLESAVELAFQIGSLEKINFNLVLERLSDSESD